MENITLNNEQLDALKEIANIGAGNAAIALSQLLNKKVLITVPNIINFFGLDKVSDYAQSANPSEISVAISLNMLGPFKGCISVLSSKKNTLLLIDILTGKTPGSTEVLNLIELSAFSECANIISCAYLNAVGQLLNIHQLIPAMGKIMLDNAGELNKFFAKEFLSSNQSYILPLEIHMYIEEIQLDLTVSFLLEQDSVKKILSIVGLSG